MSVSFKAWNKPNSDEVRVYVNVFRDRRFENAHGGYFTKGEAGEIVPHYKRSYSGIYGEAMQSVMDNLLAGQDFNGLLALVR